MVSRGPEDGHTGWNFTMSCSERVSGFLQSITGTKCCKEFIPAVLHFRGFGDSTDTSETEDTVAEDARSALAWLRSSDNFNQDDKVNNTDSYTLILAKGPSPLKGFDNCRYLSGATQWALGWL